MSKNRRDSFSFAVMAALIFLLASLSGSHTFSSNGVDSVWDLCWISLYRHLDNSQNFSFRYSFTGLRVDALVRLIFFSLGLTWILAKALRRRKSDIKPEDVSAEHPAVGRNVWLLTPAAISALADLLVFPGFPFGLERYLPPLFGGISHVIFFLSPLLVVYTIILAVYFMGGKHRDGAFWSLIFLLPQVYACYVLVGWFTHGIALET
jgi:hypothetical protein